VVKIWSKELFSLKVEDRASRSNNTELVEILSRDTNFQQERTKVKVLSIPWYGTRIGVRECGVQALRGMLAPILIAKSAAMMSLS
jgi:hypothetical protein